MTGFALLAAVLLIVSNVNAASPPVGLPAAGTTVGLSVYGGMGDVDMVNASGMRLTKNSISTYTSEPTPHQYDFSYYSSYQQQCAALGIRTMYLLGPQEAIPGEPFDSPAFVDHFTELATAAANDPLFKGKGTIYELWNEPDGNSAFYGMGAETYMRLARAVIPAIHAADPTAVVVAPGIWTTSGINGWLQDCYRKGPNGEPGLLDLADAISVHPYRNGIPETVVSDYNKLRSAMNAAVSQGDASRTLPIVSSEWGYSTGATNADFTPVTPQGQADYLARICLVNMSQGIPITTWYTWQDNETNSDNYGANFGMVKADGTVKAAYDAMQLLTSSLKGTTFSERLTSTSFFFPNRDWLLSFSLPNGEKTLAAWTTGSSRTVLIPDWGLIHLTNTPQYINPVPEPGAFLLLIAGLFGLFGGGSRCVARCRNRR